MSARKARYRKKENQQVIAVQLNLKTDGFRYRKWGAIQQCKRRDWLVDNGGDIYTIDNDVFKKTYTKVSPGIYKKISDILACEARESGSIQTREGSTSYKKGDYLVYNEDDSMGYAIPGARFHELYVLVKED